VKPDPRRWLDLQPGDSIIERGNRSDAKRLAASMAKRGLVFRVEALPVERPQLITLVALTGASRGRTKDDASKA